MTYTYLTRPAELERTCIVCGGLLKIATKPDALGRLICTSRECRPHRATPYGPGVPLPETGDAS
jgi:hypothetical protein